MFYMQRKCHLRFMLHVSWYFRGASRKNPWLASGKKNLWLAKIRKCPLHRHYNYISSLNKGRSVSNNNRYLILTKQNIAVHCIFFFRHWSQFYYSRTCRANSTCKNKKIIIANRIMHTLSG